MKIKSKSFKLPVLAIAVGVAGLLAAPIITGGDSSAATYKKYTWHGAAKDYKFSEGDWRDENNNRKLPTEGSMIVIPCVMKTEGTSGKKFINDLNVKLKGVEYSGVSNCTKASIDKLNLVDNAIFINTGKPQDQSALSIGKDSQGNTAVTGGSKSITFNNSPPKLDVDLGKKKLTSEIISLNGGNTGLTEFVATKKINVINSSINEGHVGPKAEIVLDNGTLHINATSSKLEMKNKLVVKNKSSINVPIKSELAKPVTITLSGDVDLQGELPVRVPEGFILKFTGQITSTGATPKQADPKWDKGQIIIEKKIIYTNTPSTPTTPTTPTTPAKVNPVDIAKICKNNNGAFEVKKNQVGTLSENTKNCINGKVYAGGILKGNGTIQNLTIDGTITPGNSIGKIETTNILNLNSTSIFEVEMLNKNSYDKLVVGKDFGKGGSSVAPDASPVNIAEGAILDIKYLPGGKFKKGDKITLIENLSDRAIKGEFKDMPEGAILTIDGRDPSDGTAAFKLSYKGGDGNNDLVLEALNDSSNSGSEILDGLVVPGKPNTGAKAFLTNNPITLGLSALGAVTSILYLVKRRG